MAAIIPIAKEDDVDDSSHNSGISAELPTEAMSNIPTALIPSENSSIGFHTVTQLTQTTAASDTFKMTSTQDIIATSPIGLSESAGTIVTARSSISSENSLGASSTIEGIHTIILPTSSTLKLETSTHTTFDPSLFQSSRESLGTEYNSLDRSTPLEKYFSYPQSTFTYLPFSTLNSTYTDISSSGTSLTPPIHNRTTTDFTTKLSSTSVSLDRTESTATSVPTQPFNTTSTGPFTRSNGGSTGEPFELPIREELKHIYDLVETEGSFSRAILKSFQMLGASNLSYLLDLQKAIEDQNEEISRVRYLASVLQNVTHQTGKNSSEIFELIPEIERIIRAGIASEFVIEETESIVDGLYMLPYGVVKSQAHTLVFTDSTMTVQDGIIFISGTMLTACSQRDNGPLEVSQNSRLVKIVGDFESWISLSNPNSTFRMEKLTGNSQLLILHEPTELSFVDDQSISVFTKLWNISLSSTSTISQSQRDITVTSFAFVEDLHILLKKSLQTEQFRKGESIEAATCVFTMNTGAGQLSVTLREGFMKLIKDDGSTISFVFSFSSVEMKHTEGYWDEGLHSPVIFENVDRNVLVENSVLPVHLKISAAKDGYILLPLSFPGTNLPGLENSGSVEREIYLEVLNLDSVNEIMSRIQRHSSITVRGELLYKSRNITLTNCTINIFGETLIASSADSMNFSLTQMRYKLKHSENITYLIVQQGRFNDYPSHHKWTNLHLSGDGRIFIEGGFLIRNETGVLLIAADMSAEKSFKETVYKTRTQNVLLNSYNYTMEFLTSVEDALIENADIMTREEMFQIAANSMDTSIALIETLKNSEKSFLKSDINRTKAYEEENFNDIFNVLPEDPADIRYVEEYTDDEWGREAIQIAFKKTAKAASSQILSIMNTFSDSIAQKELEENGLPFMHTIESGDSGIVLAGGNETALLNKAYRCHNWEIEFPEKFSDLNLNLSPSQNVFLNIFCFETQLHFYSENSAELANSGTLEVILKDENMKSRCFIISLFRSLPRSAISRISKALIPIVITHSTINGDISQPNLFLGTFSEQYTVLNLGWFKIPTWNSSLEIEIRTLDERQQGKNDLELFYLSFQSIPGVRDRQYDFRHDISQSGVSRYFIANELLENAYNNFIFGLGQLGPNRTGEPMTENMFEHISGNRTHEITVQTKGCYAFNYESELFDSDGIVSNDPLGKNLIKCGTTHLSSFSVGLFVTEVNNKFSFNFTIDIISKNVQPFIIILCSWIFFFVVWYYKKCNTTTTDTTINPLRTLKGNQASWNHLYVITVYTSFHRLSSTTSRVYFSLAGSRASESSRELVGEYEYETEHPLRWGSCARFLLATREYLGDIQYLRLYMEDDESGNLVSWHCSKIKVYDVQLEKTYNFPIHAWLSQAQGCQLECLADPMKSDEKQIIDLHALFGHISYLAVFLNNQDHFIRGQTYLLSLLLSTSCLQFVLIWVAKQNEWYSGKDISVFTELTVVLILAALFTVINMIVPYMFRKCFTADDFAVVQYYEALFKDYKRPRGFLSPTFHQIIHLVIITIMVFCFIHNTHSSLKLSGQESLAFTKLFFSISLLWLLLLEPIKGFLSYLCSVNSTKAQCSLTEIEKSFFLDRTKFTHKLNNTNSDSGVIKNCADSLKLLISRVNRMNEAALFRTMKDMFFLGCSSLIFLSMMLVFRDQNGYHYHQNVNNLFNLDGNSDSFSNIKSLQDFWDWANNSFAPNMYAAWSDGNAAYDMRGFLNDKVSRSVGLSILRPTILYNNSKMREKDWGISPKKEYQYMTSDAIGSEKTRGYFGSYEGGGYACYLQGTTSAIRARFNKLREEEWIDRHTRSHVGDARGRLVGVSVESLRLLKGEESNLKSIVEAVYIGYCAVKFCFELFNLMKDRKENFNERYLRSSKQCIRWILIGGYGVWETIDFLVGIISVLSCYFYLMKFSYLGEIVDTALETNGNVFINLTRQRDMELMFNISLGIMGFFVTMRIMNIMKFNHRFSVLTDTLRSAAPSILQFGVFFFCFLNTFIFVLYFEYQSFLESYNTYFITLQTLVSCLLGKTSGGKAYDSTSMGATYFICFMIFGTIVVLNMFVMIVMQEFEAVRTDADRFTDSYDIYEHLLFKIKKSGNHVRRSDLEALQLCHSYKHVPIIHRFRKTIGNASYQLRAIDGSLGRDTNIRRNEILKITEFITGTTSLYIPSLSD
ncbi:unnamed protein product [Auanema sp. JU1783]|nr:unnamed protein product [Auanema sp. JU1783]